MTSEHAIRRAADEIEIRNTVARLAMATDSGALDEYASLFTEDAQFEVRSEPGKPPMIPPTKGRAAILAGGMKRRADGLTGPGTGIVHAIQTSAISITGDTAKARTYVVIYKNSQATPEASVIRVYNDEFVRTLEGWKVAARFIDPV
jgi:hypothetical protein